MKSVFPFLTACLTAVILAACASGGGMGGGGSPPDVEIRSGLVEQIHATEVKSTHDQGFGAIVGDIAGAGLGSLIGAGTGRDVAIAGAIGGNVAQNRFFDKPQPARQVFERLKSSVLIVVTQPVNPTLARGMRVYVVGSGNEARVVPAT